MNIKLKTVILECRDIPQLLSFYTGLLHWPVVFEIDTFVGIHSNQDEMGIAFQYDENYIPPTWPSKPGHQQMMAHLDFAVDDKNELKEAMEKAIKLGAKIADEQYGGEEWVTMLDPAGHPFCFVVWNH
ncbi:glyoxalase/bleomycin resistance/dioxygenase family protein [Lacrimispora amygdalina]|uniref:Glyoxalase/bleomycin resistance/dioxygenase family protein n=1 Tax=Lacrimispora amygdalina TaxID=253257 RepID=A0A3E2N4P8_9FIRM|nr:VOC family protein [Clostridium indicum]RFZ75960.1 VOC family protein [Clostridium indicum]